jgi:hypothetical protein
MRATINDHACLIPAPKVALACRLGAYTLHSPPPAVLAWHQGGILLLKYHVNPTWKIFQLGPGSVRVQACWHPECSLSLACMQVGEVRGIVLKMPSLRRLHIGPASVMCTPAAHKLLADSSTSSSDYFVLCPDE